MKITFQGLTDALRERLRERLTHAARLRCAEHGQPVVAVTIHGRENGWFDSVWTTCCTSLETQAATIVKGRC
jgi:2-keto-3-deoxy-galactonokinase